MLKLFLAAWAVLAVLFGVVLGGIGAVTASTAGAAAVLADQQEAQTTLVGATFACENDGTGATLYANAARAAGFPEEDVDGDGVGELLTSIAVGGAESSFDPQQGNVLADGRTHRGPMQISSLHLTDKAINVEGGDQRYDAAVNYRMAYRLWISVGKKWSPTWSAHTNGAWKGKLIEAQAALDGTTVNACAVAVVAAGKTGGAAGNLNGRLDESQLCVMRYAPPPTIGHRLECNAEASFAKLTVAYAQVFGRPICITDSYRDYAGQVAVRAARPGLAAVPGTSNHGWGKAVDLCGGIQTFGTPQYEWMLANAPRFGWHNPTWAQQGGSREEAWHWEVVGLS